MNGHTDYTTDAFINRLYASRPDTSDLPVEQKRARLRTVTGMDRLDALNHTPVWRSGQIYQADSYTVEQAEVETLPGLFTPVYILTPPHYKQNFVYAHGQAKYATN